MPNLFRLCAWLLALSLLLAFTLWQPLAVAREGTGPADLDLTDGRANILLVGVDHRPGDWGKDFRAWPAREVRSWADALVLVNLHGPCATALSIPRDTLAEIPGVGRDRINRAMFVGGIDLLRTTVANQLAVPVHRYVLVDFNGFREFITAIGGVEVEVRRPLVLPDGSTWLAPGTHRLTGEQALRFVRHRYGDLRQDLDRIERQQEFLNALLRELREERLRRGMVLVTRSPALFKSNLQVSELLALYRLGQRLEPDQTLFRTLPGTLVDGQYWEPDRDGWEKLRPRFLGAGPDRPPCTGMP